MRIAAYAQVWHGDRSMEPQDNHLTVTQLVNAIKLAVETDFDRVQVAGEISSFKPWRSGHWYFDLKDAGALLPSVMFRGNCAQVKFDVQDGMQVVLTGKVSVYAPQSKVQFIVEKMEPLGVGALALAFEQLKKKLELEGLFSPARKIPLPLLPKQIGIVTSPQGAAIRDMLRILQHRHPGVSVLLAPVRVQGEGAALEIAKAIAQLDASGECDVMIVGRGGGSLEDLWAFNEEVVARAIAACKTPIVSAVGHETDFTIADFVADKRCATPTHAAQEVVPSLLDLQEHLHQRGMRLHRYMQSLLTALTLRLERAGKKLQEPKLLLLRFMQRVDIAAQRLQALAPHVVLERNKNKVHQLDVRLQQAILRQKQRYEERIKLLAARLHALSPLQVLARGFSVAYTGTGEKRQLVSHTTQVHAGDTLQVRLADGLVNTLVQEVIHD